MDTMQAFAMGEANRGQPQRVFDWVQDCWRWAADGGWDASTYWPDSALRIVAGAS